MPQEGRARLSTSFLSSVWYSGGYRRFTLIEKNETIVVLKAFSPFNSHIEFRVAKLDRGACVCGGYPRAAGGSVGSCSFWSSILFVFIHWLKDMTSEWQERHY